MQWPELSLWPVFEFFSPGDLGLRSAEQANPNSPGDLGLRLALANPNSPGEDLSPRDHVIFAISERNPNYIP